MPQRDLEREPHRDERQRAQRRLDDAVEHKERSSERYEAVQGTTAELDAYVQLEEAEQEVAARDRWVEWADGDRVVPPWPDLLPLHRLLG
jgi:hypothetical protein